MVKLQKRRLLQMVAAKWMGFIANEKTKKKIMYIFLISLKSFLKVSNLDYEFLVIQFMEYVTV